MCPPLVLFAHLPASPLPSPGLLLSRCETRSADEHPARTLHVLALPRSAAVSGCRFPSVHSSPRAHEAGGEHTAQRVAGGTSRDTRMRVWPLEVLIRSHHSCRGSEPCSFPVAEVGGGRGQAGATMALLSTWQRWGPGQPGAGLTSQGQI